MDVLQHVQTVLEIIQAPSSLWKEHKKLRSEFRRGLRSIKLELEMIKADMENYDELHVLDLAYDIEDFVQGTLLPWASGSLMAAVGMDPIHEHLDSIRSFKERIEELGKRQQKSLQSGPNGVSPAAYYTDQKEDRYLVGVDKPKSEILELLSFSPEAGQHELKVISIVGPIGVGKTVLARAVFEDSSIPDTFECRAWVVASGCNDAWDLLGKVPRDILEKRYLLVIDDVQGAELWKDTVDAFPKNGKSSRIIVTTRIRSVATACSYGSFLYSMQCLGEADSIDLFRKMVYGSEKKLVRSLLLGSNSIFSKCGGLPLALRSAAKCLSIKRNILKRKHCEQLGETLGSNYLVDNKNGSAFGEMRRRLAQCYDSLPDYAHKTCLLSLSTFPHGHQINCKSLVRRLVAEGLDARVGLKCFKEMIDRSIIEPILVDDSAKVVSRFQVHSIILEFTIEKSVSKNFITLIHEHDPLRTVDSSVVRVRRLAVQSSTQERFDEVADTSALRSLTMFNSEVVADFKSFKMLRILELQGCKGMDKRLLEGMCELLLLRYLSVKKTDVDTVPKNIEKLQFLETLDIRDTRVAILPVEVIMLPKLAYLFGKFELPHMHRAPSKLSEFLTKKSELHTLAGFIVAQGSQCFEQVILEARKLRKVKVWSKDAPHSPAPGSTPTLRAPYQGNDISLVSSLQKRFTVLDSVSIDSNGLCKDFMDSLKGPCKISSIKIRGALDRLPNSDTLEGLCNLTKLQLFSTGLNSQELSILQIVPCLENLKLVENRGGFWDDDFVVGNDGFESLHELWFEAPKLPRLKIEEGALISLTSLHLLCPDTCQTQVIGGTQGGLGIEGISHLTNLSEVILHHSATEAKVQAWKSEANMHSNRPSIKKQSIIG